MRVEIPEGGAIGRPALTLLVRFFKSHMHGTRSRRAFMTRCMNVDEPKEVS